MGETNTYRDALYNVDTSGRRVGFFPKRPKGRFYKRRIFVSSLLLVIFFALPWIKVNGEPFFLLNVLERKFIIFSVTFWPQDFLLFALFMVSMAVFVFLFTAVLGRIWCGWTCPQTVFLEMVYRRIEFWIEGDAAAQRRLARAPWKWDKVRKRILKHGIFLAIAFWVSNTVLGFIIGMDNVMAYMKSSPLEHPVTFAAVILNTGVFYFVFAWFREQACIYMCPYGRLQGVLLDQDSLVISYDYKRGEPRAKLKAKDTDPNVGDCIDCKQCVAVCPTGIDIRNGIQLECVNCTACIDACDEIMDKVGRPRGLIRYATERQIEEERPFRLTGRHFLYMGVFSAFVTVFLILFLSSGDLNVKLLRDPGQTFTETSAGNYMNIFSVTVVNKSADERSFDFRLHEAEGKVELIGNKELTVEGGKNAGSKIKVELPPEEIEGKGMSFDLEIDMLEDGKVIKTLSTKFNGPML